MAIFVHVETGDLLVEAFDEGVPLPLFRHPDGTWEPADVGTEALLSDYLPAVWANDTDILAEARSVCEHFISLLPSDGVDEMTMSQIRDLLAQRGNLTLHHRAHERLRTNRLAV
ncbi:hypothetical protein [Salinarimonas chemoclinalis]|uniref:hypothetical protein n=1 Tax=Salinarimonas chemoclinalis TaxID=3241599 RepID=UPI003557A32C